MQQRRYRIGPALLIVGVLLTLLTVAPTAVGATELNIRFGGTAAGGQQSLVLSANGFGPGELVSITGLVSDGRIAQYPDVATNGIGGFDVGIAYEPAVFRIRAVGQLTGITAFADVGPVTGTPPGFLPPYSRLGPCDIFDTGFFYNSCPGASGFGSGVVFQPIYGPTVPVVVAPGTGSPATATVNTPITFTLTGFAPGEQVSAFATGPDASVRQIGAAAANADGSVTVTVTFPSAGQWTVTAKGQSSQKQTVTGFTVA